MTELAPILLFVYNRPIHTERTIEALKKNNLAAESNLNVFSDGPKANQKNTDIDAVRRYIKTIDGFKRVEIFESKKNNGLANSIISGITQIFDTCNKLIVLEDDLETSKNFIEYMNDALNYYKDSDHIWSIAGYNPPITIPTSYKEEVYLSHRSTSWGWATWKDRWEKNDWKIKDFKSFSKNKKKINRFNRGGMDLFPMLKDQMEGKIDSWAIRWCYNQFKDNSFCIYPVKSKIRNLGTDATGTHCGARKKYDVKLDTGGRKIIFPKSLAMNQEILNQFSAYYGTWRKMKMVQLLKFLRLYNLIKKIFERFRLI